MTTFIWQRRSQVAIVLTALTILCVAIIAPLSPQIAACPDSIRCGRDRTTYASRERRLEA